MRKFKVGDIITPRPDHFGFENAKVISIFKEKNGREYYKLGIMNGIAIIPADNESSYELFNEKKRKKL